MNEAFGSGNGNPFDDEPEEVEVVFVPASAAKRAGTPGVGVVDLTTPLPPARDRTAVILKDPDAQPAPGSAFDPGAPPEERLDAAWEHLRRNELDEAVAIARDLARQHPDLTPAKMILARCCINRKEYQKALAILQSIPEGDRNAEAFYFLGLCRGRMGDVPGAMEALERSIADSMDERSKQRAGDLLQHLRGGRAACPECGNRVQYADLVDIGNKTVCADCAAAVANSQHAAAKAGPAAGTPGGRGGFFRRLSRLAASVPLLLALAYAGLYAAAKTVPDHYEKFRTLMPAGWDFLPKSGGPVDSVAGTPAPSPSRLPVEMAIDSPPLECAIAGVPLTHQLSIDGMPGIEGDYAALFSPEPKGRYRIDNHNGQFHWIPSADDAGKTFDLAFDVAFKASRAAKQTNRVHVYAPPQFRTIYTPPEPEPGEIVHLLSADVTGDGRPELLTVRGRYWNARLTVLQETVDGFFHPLGRAAFAGRPAGAGLLDVNGEKWIAVADYWSSRLRYYAVRNGDVVEAPEQPVLPGRPVLAGFDSASGVSAALCRSNDSMRLLCHRAVDWSHVEKAGDWSVPDGHVWRKVLMLPERAGEGLRPRALLVGGDAERSVFLASPDTGDLLPVKAPIAGVVLDAAVDADGRVRALIRTDGGRCELAVFSVAANGAVSGLTIAPLGTSPLLNGIASLTLFGAGTGAESSVDTAVLSATKLEVAWSGPSGRSSVAQWDLPSPSRLLGAAVSLPQGKGLPDRVVYQDVNGSLWSAGLPAPGGKSK